MEQAKSYVLIRNSALYFFIFLCISPINSCLEPNEIINQFCHEERSLAEKRICHLRLQAESSNRIQAALQTFEILDVSSTICMALVLSVGLNMPRNTANFERVSEKGFGRLIKHPHPYLEAMVY
jgi:hypothetical protein